MSEETLTVRVPLTVGKRGGRKVVVAPDQAAVVQEREPANWTLVKNLARAFRWQRMLERGEYATIVELARAEGVTDSYVGRIMKLALKAAADVEALVRACGSLDQSNRDW
ncbi:MAG: hypothetical protein KIT43_02905 [Bauldia sp.]|nr:hypothetical protein [Bauldia sp.]